MFGTEICDDLSCLGIAEGIREGRHFLTAIEDPLGDFFRRPGFVLADIYERGPLFCSDATGAVAMFASLVAEEDRAGHLVGFGGGTEKRRSKGNGEKSESKKT